MPTKAKYNFLDFLQEHAPYPYTAEQAFGVLAWMIDTGQGYSQKTPWGVQTIETLLSRNNSVVSMYEIEPITSLQHAINCIRNGIISTQARGNLKKWRDDYGINAYSSKTISFFHAAPFKDAASESEIQSALSSLFNATGRLGTQLNEYHSRAREVYGVCMRYHTRSFGWKFVLKYGYKGSVWESVLSRQRPRETLLPVIRRASEKLHEYMTFKSAA